MERYTAGYFRERLPEWKRKKDSFIVRHTLRPLSFYTASWAANHGIGANDVSIFSMGVAVVASALFIPANKAVNIAGALLVWVWMILDCTDGNLARSVKKQPYGEFVDGASSYILISLLYACLGIAAYRTKGLLFEEGNWFPLFCGVFAGSADSLARLLYQKFENERMKQGEKQAKVSKEGGRERSKPGAGQAEEAKEQREAGREWSKPEAGQAEEHQEAGGLKKLHDRIDKEIGLNGMMLPGLLVCTILGWFDLFTVFYAVFFTGTLCASAWVLIRRVKEAMRAEDERND